MDKHTTTPWYVGTQNDILYIINKPPRPSHDTMADVPDVAVIATMNACKDAENGEYICRAVNTHGDLVMLVSRLATRLSKIEPASKLVPQAMDYLVRNKIALGPLREEEAA